MLHAPPYAALLPELETLVLIEEVKAGLAALINLKTLHGSPTKMG
jgi:hypothetical protein